MSATKTPNQSQEARATGKKKFKRRRCENCNRLYMPTREDQRFCQIDGDNCRKEFHRYGSSYGPLKTGLHKAIDKKYAGLAKTITTRLLPIVSALAKLEVRIVNLEKEYERHTHEFYTDGSGGEIETRLPTEVRHRASEAFRKRREEEFRAKRNTAALSSGVTSDTKPKAR